MATEDTTTPPQAGWTRMLTHTGRYEYQFQGRTPAVRNAQYEDAHDYQFLVLDEEGWLYRIPVKMTTAAEAELSSNAEAAASSERGAIRALGIAEVQLHAGLEKYRPRQNAPYEELDGYFAVDATRARELAGKI